MVRLVKQYRRDPQIRALALELVGDLEGKAFRAEAERILEYIRSCIRYVQDIRDVETLHDPLTLLEIGQGDCDDMAVLAASLLESIGHPTRFVATGYQEPDCYEHVYLETKIGDRWLPMECTVMDLAFGDPMPQPVARMVVHV